MKPVCLWLMIAVFLAGCCHAPAAPACSPSADASDAVDFDAMEYLSTAPILRAYATIDCEDASDTLDLAALTRLVNQAAAAPIPADQSEALTRNEFWWIELETGQGSLKANVLAGPQQEGIVYFCYTAPQGDRTDFYASAPELASMLRQCSRREGKVEQEALSLVQAHIDEKAQAMCQAWNDCFAALESPEFTGWQVAELACLRAYDDLVDGTVSVYTLDLAFTCRHPERISLAGGIWVDDQGRLRDNYQIAYMVVVERAGRIDQVHFLAGDEMASTDDETIRQCLSWIL